MPDSRVLTIGVDIGGTKIAAGLVDDQGAVVARSRRRTPSTSAHDVLIAIEELVAELSGGLEVAGVGIGAAGYVDRAGETVVFSPHLAWRNEPLRRLAAERLGLPVVLDNDANATGWAELKFGAARDRENVVVVNLGTGIGGAVIIDGGLVRGHHGMAGEFGHQQVVPDGIVCECGNRGCWEKYASGRVLQQRALEEVASDTPFGRELVEVSGSVDGVEGATVGQLASHGHPVARHWVAEVGRWLGVGLANIAAGLDPELFVIGGGVSDNGDVLLDPARDAFAASLTGRGYRAEAPIVRAALGPDAGFVGAAALASR